MAVALVILSPARAHAQACCASASAIGTARLAPHEDAVLGAGVRFLPLYASVDREGRFVEAPPGAIELGFEQDFAATLRVLRKGQITFLVPIVETYRAVRGATDAGGGVGDVQLGARYDFVETGMSPTWPGIALSFGLAIPTGRAPEAASNPLATDATGTGSLQASAELAVEKPFGDWFIHLSGSALWRSPRIVGDLHEHRGPAFNVLAAGGRSFRDLVAALTVSYRAEIDGRFEGKTVPDSGHELTRLGVAAGYSLSSDWRFQGSVSADLPVSPLTRNQPVGAGLYLMLLRGGW